MKKMKHYYMLFRKLCYFSFSRSMYPMGYISKLSEKQSIIKFPITKNDKTALPNTTTQLKKKKY